MERVKAHFDTSFVVGYFGLGGAALPAETPERALRARSSADFGRGRAGTAGGALLGRAGVPPGCRGAGAGCVGASYRFGFGFGLWVANDQQRAQWINANAHHACRNKNTQTQVK